MESGRKMALLLFSVLFVIAACTGVATANAGSHSEQDENVTLELKTFIDKLSTLERKLEAKTIDHESQHKQLKTEISTLEKELEAKTIDHENQLKQLKTENENVTLELKIVIDKVSTLEKEFIDNEAQVKQLKTATPVICLKYVIETPKNATSGTIKFMGVVLDKDNNYNRNTGEFIAPVKGIYVFHLTVSTGKIGRYRGVSLIDGPARSQGRVVVEKDGEFGTVCDDDFDSQEIKVICRELGYSEGRYLRSGPSGPYAKAPIWLDNLGCRGVEHKLSDCEHRGWGIHDCNHGEDVNVQCYGTLSRYLEEEAIFEFDGNDITWNRMTLRSWETGSMTMVAELDRGKRVRPTFSSSRERYDVGIERAQLNGYLLTPL